MAHNPIQNNLKHLPDFQIEYEFLSPEEGGRQSGPPSQGYRSDFWYKNPTQSPTQLYMICPEFLDAEGRIILDDTIPVPTRGLANMWIMNPERRIIHQQHIQADLEGFIMEGPNRVARCRVTRILDLMVNPTKR